MQKGFFLELHSGDRWKLPTVTTIDQELALKDDGKWEFKPLRELSWFSEEIEKRRSAFEIGDTTGDSVELRLSYDPRDAISLIIRALRINYRITPEVVHMMRLLTMRDVSVAYGALFGVTFKDETQK